MFPGLFFSLSLPLMNPWNIPRVRKERNVSTARPPRCSRCISHLQLNLHGVGVFEMSLQSSGSCASWRGERGSTLVCMPLYDATGSVMFEQVRTRTGLSFSCFRCLVCLFLFCCCFAVAEFDVMGFDETHGRDLSTPSISSFPADHRTSGRMFLFGWQAG